MKESQTWALVGFFIGFIVGGNIMHWSMVNAGWTKPKAPEPDKETRE